MKKDKRLQKLVMECVGACCKEGRINAQKTIKVIKKLKSLPTDQAIFAISEFLKGIKREKNRKSLTIESSILLSEIEVKKLAGFLRREFVFTDVKEVVVPQLLGGLRIKIGDDILDYSLINKITQLGGVIHG